MGTKKLPIETKQDRLVVYEKALKEFLEHIKAHPGAEYPGLCITIRDCSDRSLVDSSFSLTSWYFPEFGECYNGRPTKFLNCLDKNEWPTNEWREEVLKYCIEQCQNG